MREVASLSKGNRERKGLSVNITLRSFFAVCAVYLSLPVAVFFMGWLKIWIAVPATLILCLMTALFVRDSVRSPSKELLLKEETSFEVPLIYIIILAAAAVLIALISDVGEYVWGSADHAYRRAIFRDLVNYDWPVFYDLSKQSDPVINSYLPDTVVGFSYYLTFWTVPAVIGKVLGFAAGNFCLLLWASAGLFLTLTGMSMALRKKTYAVIFTMICFAGLDFIPYIYNEFIGTKQEWMWLEGYTRHIVYISNINNILNVFNQCIPCWLIAVMFMLTKNNRGVGFLGAMMFPYSPWATIGLVPIAIWSVFTKKNRSSSVKGNILNILDPVNIVTPLLILFIFAPYFTANGNATSVSGNTIGFYGGIGAFLAGYLLVILVEILPSFLLLFGARKKDSLFYTVLAALLIMPFYKISYQNDFTMRGAMPEFFILSVMLAGVIAEKVETTGRDKNGHVIRKTPREYLKLAGGALLVFVMSLIALQQLLITVISTFDGSRRFTEDIYSFGDMRHPEYGNYYTVNEQFFVYDHEEQFFYKYLAR